jgi:renalase
MVADPNVPLAERPRDVETRDRGGDSADSLPIVVVGAGLAGLVAARLLRAAGYGVEILEKSRGTGGRLNTRREGALHLDRGVRYWSDRGGLSRQLRRGLLGRGVLGPWTSPAYCLDGQGNRTVADEARYVAPNGLSAIAKALADDLPIRFNRRALLLDCSPIAPDLWRVRCDRPRPDASPEPPDQFEARALLLAAPAPQTAALLNSLGTLEPQCAHYFGNVAYGPCLTVTAGYGMDVDLDAAPWQGWGSITFEGDRDLAWLSREDRKQVDAPEPAIVLQTTADGAESYIDLEGDALAAAGPALLKLASDRTALPLDQADWVRVHRWRYGTVQRAAGVPCLILGGDRWPPLVCAGDWCIGDGIEAALQSGVAAAEYLAKRLGDRPLIPPGTDLDLATLL